mmetsp:Transcript_32965/g.93764  ORF Transcript_32965/g.93764 Transcript_32965/m.93764 type:complete len:287 (-) Transcript_32965:20-880(-)
MPPRHVHSARCRRRRAGSLCKPFKPRLGGNLRPVVGPGGLPGGRVGLRGALGGPCCPPLRSSPPRLRGHNAGAAAALRRPLWPGCGMGRLRGAHRPLIGARGIIGGGQAAAPRARRSHWHVAAAAAVAAAFVHRTRRLRCRRRVLEAGDGEGAWLPVAGRGGAGRLGDHDLALRQPQHAAPRLGGGGRLGCRCRAAATRVPTGTGAARSRLRLPRPEPHLHVPRRGRPPPSAPPRRRGGPASGGAGSAPPGRGPCQAALAAVVALRRGELGPPRGQGRGTTAAGRR